MPDTLILGRHLNRHPGQTKGYLYRIIKLELLWVKPQNSFDFSPILEYKFFKIRHYGYKIAEPCRARRG